MMFFPSCAASLCDDCGNQRATTLHPRDYATSVRIRVRVSGPNQLRLRKNGFAFVRTARGGFDNAIALEAFSMAVCEYKIAHAAMARDKTASVTCWLAEFA